MRLLICEKEWDIGVAPVFQQVAKRDLLPLDWLCATAPGKYGVEPTSIPALSAIAGGNVDAQGQVRQAWKTYMRTERLLAVKGSQFWQPHGFTDSFLVGNCCLCLGCEEWFTQIF